MSQNDGLNEHVGKHLEQRDEWAELRQRLSKIADGLTTIFSVGTRLNIEQAGGPAVISPEMCHLWQKSLAQLAQLVEADLPSFEPNHGAARMSNCKK